MLLHLIKLIIWILTIGYSIVIAGYYINKTNKKPRRKGPGNWRMPKEVEIAILEWYKMKERSCGIANSATQELAVNAAEEINCGNAKCKPFPKLKTKKSDFINQQELFAVWYSKSFTKNKSSFLTISSENKINPAKKFLKNSMPFPQQVFACHCKKVTVWFW